MDPSFDVENFNPMNHLLTPQQQQMIEASGQESKPANEGGRGLQCFLILLAIISFIGAAASFYQLGANSDFGAKVLDVIHLEKDMLLLTGIWASIFGLGSCVAAYLQKKEPKVVDSTVYPRGLYNEVANRTSSVDELEPKKQPTSRPFSEHGQATKGVNERWMSEINDRIDLATSGRTTKLTSEEFLKIYEEYRSNPEKVAFIKAKLDASEKRR